MCTHVHQSSHVPFMCYYFTPVSLQVHTCILAFLGTHQWPCLEGLFRETCVHTSACATFTCTHECVHSPVHMSLFIFTRACVPIHLLVCICVHSPCLFVYTPLSMCKPPCACVFVHTHLSMCVHSSVCMCLCTPTCVSVYIPLCKCVYIYSSECICLYVCTCYVWVHSLVCVCVYSHVHVYPSLCVSMYTHLCMCAHMLVLCRNL